MRYIPPAIDQGAVNNCTVVCLCYGLKAAYGLDFDANWIAGLRETPNASIKGNLDVLMQYGGLPVCKYSIDPTSTILAQKWTRKYKSRLLRAAKKYKIGGYARVETIDQLHAALNAGQFVAFSAGCKTRSIGLDRVYRPYDGTANSIVHAMSAWYVKPNGLIRILNSLGADWGENGQADMTAEDILRGHDCWAYRIDAERKDEVRIEFESAVPVGKKAKIYAEPSNKSAVVGYLRVIDDGVILSKRGDWREVAVAQTADLTVTGWIQGKYLREV